MSYNILSDIVYAAWKIFWKMQFSLYRNEFSFYNLKTWKRKYWKKSWKNQRMKKKNFLIGGKFHKKSIFSPEEFLIEKIGVGNEDRKILLKFSVSGSKFSIFERLFLTMSTFTLHHQFLSLFGRHFCIRSKKNPFFHNNFFHFGVQTKALWWFAIYRTQAHLSSSPYTRFCIKFCSNLFPFILCKNVEKEMSFFKEIILMQYR